MYETLSQEEDIKINSERSFGCVMCVFFMLVSVFPLFFGGSVRMWAGGIAILFLLLALFAPFLLKPLNFLWFKLGMLLHMITNPIIMGIIFFGTVVPTALIFRIQKKDILNLSFDPQAQSYWISRRPSGPEPSTMKDQF